MDIQPFEGNDDKRLGKYASDGSVERWPEFDITGQPYSRPANTIDLSSTPGHFVVIPQSNFLTLVDALKVAGVIADAAAPIAPVVPPTPSDERIVANLPATENEPFRKPKA